ncbi:DUF481 domain-containing protein [Paracoccus tegillarcae]|uniref:DUF481 domain-containing protein n=1 Tax=Paracoccus tegillarcae TaxID=1529068 RepID=A0A2K9F310_9RHOB|nr:DUF481 domain-containing protein [Paracoccus tegillarcae]AUH34752.1 DUF481 domain-containing protein [Paracoccus tegillarcae]
MKNVAILAGASAIFAALSVPAFAQSEMATGSTAAGVSAIDDQITDIEDAVQDDFDRQNDADRFGPADRRQGLFGNMSLTYSGDTGSNRVDDDGQQDLAVAGRISYNQGVFAQSVGVLIEYSEDEAESSNDKQEVTAIYDAQYYFNDRFYAFGLGRIAVDGEAMAGELDRDGFLGVGPGYRIINTADTAWRVQAGVGVSYSRRPNEDSDTEIGYIASSRFYHRFNDNVFLTNDTDYITSDARDLATNSFGLGLRMSESLATKVSYDTRYENTKAASGDSSDTENSLGVSIVYGF